MLIHSDSNHLWSNIAVQIILAFLCTYSYEGISGTIKVFLAYILGGISGAMTFILFDESAGVLVGCSAGVFALLGLCVIDLCIDVYEYCKRKNSLGNTLPRQHKIVAFSRFTVFVVIILGDLVNFFTGSQHHGTVRVHMAGFFGGILCGSIFLMFGLLHRFYEKWKIADEPEDPKASLQELTVLNRSESSDEGKGCPRGKVETDGLQSQSLTLEETLDLLPKEHRKIFRQVSNLYQ